MLIVNAKIKTAETVDYENGFIQVENGKIIAVGDQKNAPEDQNRIDAAGKWIFPGFIDPHCHIGMWEDGLGFEGDDGNEETDPLTPHLRALDAVNPLDRCFEEARAAGITTVVTGPGSANPIGGEWIAMKTLGCRIDDMLIVSPVGMKFALGENPKSSYHAKSQMPITRMATAALIREQLMKAKRYWEDQLRAKEDEDYDPPEYDAKCEALIPVLQREMKAFFHAHRADDICTAIRIAKEFGLDYVIVHATEGDLISDVIKKEHVSLIIGPVICDRSKPELRNLSPALGGRLAQSGITFALCTDHPVIPIQYLNLSCMVAIAEGLDKENALRAVTINAAEICGIADRVGSIAPGKDADLVFFEKDPFETYVKPVDVWIDGKSIK